MEIRWSAFLYLYTGFSNIGVVEFSFLLLVYIRTYFSLSFTLIYIGRSILFIFFVCLYNKIMLLDIDIELV